MGHPGPFRRPVPAWGAAGRANRSRHRRLSKLKLHVLNAAHSALAYLACREDISLCAKPSRTRIC